METQELILTALRGMGVYVLMLIVIRLMGKRTIGNFTAFDLLVALMLGEVVDEIIYGDVTFLQGSVAIITVAAVKYFTSWLDYRGLNRLLEGEPTKIIEHGEYVREGMKKELMNESEVMAALRLQSVSDMTEVKVATVETDGIVSVIKEEWAEPAQKADLNRKLKAEKKKQLPEEEPPEEKQTDTEEALTGKK